MAHRVATLQEFRDFVSRMVRVEKEHRLWEEAEEPEWAAADPDATYTVITFRMPDSKWWYNPQPGFSDFNKEICPPGVIKGLPEGGTGIRSDDDFWTEAIFPYEFREIEIGEMVAVLWPHVQDPVLHPDVVARSRPDRQMAEDGAEQQT